MLFDVLMAVISDVLEEFRIALHLVSKRKAYPEKIDDLSVNMVQYITSVPYQILPTLFPSACTVLVHL